MKKLFFVCLLAVSTFATPVVKGVELADTSKATASVELGGAALLYSVFGSYRFIPELAANLGISYLASSGTSSFSFPISLSYLAGGKGGHHFELLAGGSIVTGSANVSIGSGSYTGWYTTIGAGYRFWPSDGGFHFRATLYGLINNGFTPWFGLSFGYAFI